MSDLPCDVITFDCYGTLIDWEEGITRAFAEAAADADVELDRQGVLAAHAEIESRVQAAGYRSYREVLRQTAKGIAERQGWFISDERTDFLASEVAPEEALPTRELRNLTDLADGLA
jgi:2-haloacid dehalogenase